MFYKVERTFCFTKLSRNEGSEYPHFLSRWGGASSVTNMVNQVLEIDVHSIENCIHFSLQGAPFGSPVYVIFS